MSAAHTPGPWSWFGNARNNEIYIATENRGRRYVMGFSRWGMRGAQPMFQPEGRGLVPASRLLTFEVGDRSVRGVDAAKADDSVYRLDIRGVDCADARVIVAAPDTLDALVALRNHLSGKPNPSTLLALLANADLAIAKATGL